MSSVAKEYGTLLSKRKPEVVHNEQLNQAYIQQLEELTGKKNASPAEKKLIQLLTVLVEEYENKHHAVPNADVLNGKQEITKDQVRRLSNCFHVSPAVFF